MLYQFPESSVANTLETRTKIPKKTLKSRQHWTETTGIHTTLRQMGPIDRASILTSLISKSGVRMKARYLDILKTRDIASILEAGLNATVRNVC